MAHNFPPPQSTVTLAKGLGVASFGLGLTEVVAPTVVARMIGVEPTPSTRRLIRGLGARECAHGVAILAGNHRLVWTRVVGDAIDLALLGRAVLATRRVRGLVAFAAVAGIASADVYAAVTDT
jgi:hypothetical protein